MKERRYKMGYKTIDEANQAVIDKMIAAAPFLVDVVPAKSKIPELKENVLLHACLLYTSDAADEHRDV